MDYRERAWQRGARIVGAPPSAWRDASPVRQRNGVAVHPLWLSGSWASGVAGVQPGLPVARIGARDTRYRPAIARRPAARLLPLPLCPHSPADAHHPPGATSASDDHRGSRGRLTRQRSRLTALGSCGESPYDAAVRCCGRCGSCDTVTRGSLRWSTRGRRALL